MMLGVEPSVEPSVMSSVVSSVMSSVVCSVMSGVLRSVVCSVVTSVVSWTLVWAFAVRSTEGSLLRNGSARVFMRVASAWSMDCRSSWVPPLITE